MDINSLEEHDVLCETVNYSFGALLKPWFCAHAVISIVWSSGQNVKILNIIMERVFKPLHFGIYTTALFKKGIYTTALWYLHHCTFETAVV